MAAWFYEECIKDSFSIRYRHEHSYEICQKTIGLIKYLSRNIDRDMNNKSFDKNTRIVFVAQFMRKGGAERVMSILANDFVNKGFRVSMVLLYRERIEYAIDPRVNLIQMDWRRHCSILEALKTIPRMGGGDPLVVHFCFTMSNFSPHNRGILSLIVSENMIPPRVPYTYSVYGTLGKGNV